LALGLAPVGQEHSALTVERDLGNFRCGRTWRDDDFASRVLAECAVWAQRDRPDFEARRDCIIEPSAADADA